MVASPQGRGLFPVECGSAPERASSRASASKGRALNQRVRARHRSRPTTATPLQCGTTSGWHRTLLRRDKLSARAAPPTNDARGIARPRPARDLKCVAACCSASSATPSTSSAASLSQSSRSSSSPAASSSSFSPSRWAAQVDRTRLYDLPALAKAVEAYRSREGFRPAKLEDLVTAGLLPTLPVDGWNQPFRYERPRPAHACCRLARMAWRAARATTRTSPAASRTAARHGTPACEGPTRRSGGALAAPHARCVARPRSGRLHRRLSRRRDVGRRRRLECSKSDRAWGQ